MIQSYLVIGRANNREKTIDLLKALKSKFAVNSPDITIVSPLKNTTTIDQVRQVRSQINQRPVSLPYKYVIFEQAETLNREAQNALLKTLEEPPANAVIILEASDKSMFLPTILSRVTVVWSKKEDAEAAPTPFVDLDKEALFAEIGGLDNPKDWLDQQMVVLFRKLEADLSNQTSANFVKLTSALENCKEAKKMIDANVNPKFVLANLALNSS